MLDISNLKFDERGLLPAVVQDARSREVLMLAYMNRESLLKTLETRLAWFWSRSRNELWLKGDTSGNTQRVVEIRQDCDSDALVVMVEPKGPACHTGKQTCFYRDLAGTEIDLASTNGSPDIGEVLDQLFRLVKQRHEERPEGSYTTYLFEQGLDKILKKVGEEATETIVAAKGGNNEEVIRETADLLYHLLVLLVERGVRLEQVSAELIRRRGERKTE